MDFPDDQYSTVKGGTFGTIGRPVKAGLTKGYNLEIHRLEFEFVLYNEGKTFKDGILHDNSKQDTA